MRLELRNITKRFGSFVANDHINLVVKPGEIHCLLGENGAGKSTLMNVLYGLYQPDEGEILLNGQVQHFKGPGDAMAAGIGMVHQHFMLVPPFTVAENVVLGNEQTKAGVVLDLNSARQRVRELSKQFGFHLDPDARVEDLPVGVQQRVEIVKALARDADVIIFDEPTAVLTPQETDELMAIMRKLRSEGKAIIFITHKLREVKEVADRITVIRNGKVVGEALPTASDAELAAAMVGHAVSLQVDKAAPKLTPNALVVKDLVVTNDAGQVVVDNVSFTVQGGEVLAIAGVQGNGQTELTEALVGLQPKATGSIKLDGKELIGRSPRQILDAGVGFVPEDRNEDGMVSSFTIAENLMLNRANAKPFVRAGNLQLGFRDKFAKAKVKEYDVRTQGIHQNVGSLSGGNAQKVIIARELSKPLRLFVAAQPTRGVDVGAIEFIHKRIIETRDAGIPVVVISTELDEAAALADRILVMYRGAIVGIVPADTPRDVLGLMMAGISPEQAAAASAAHQPPTNPAVPTGPIPIVSKATKVAPGRVSGAGVAAVGSWVPPEVKAGAAPRPAGAATAQQATSNPVAPGRVPAGGVAAVGSWVPTEVKGARPTSTPSAPGAEPVVPGRVSAAGVAAVGSWVPQQVKAPVQPPAGDPVAPGRVSAAGVAAVGSWVPPQIKGGKPAKGDKA